MKHKIKGLYAITPDLADTDVLTAKVGAALGGGVSLLQYRNKTASAQLRREQAAALLSLCRDAGVPLIVNDDVDLCLSLDADGVHLGADDGNLAQARARLGPGKILGASCYREIELAHSAKRQGADYVAFGSVFASSVKPDAPRADLGLFARAMHEVDLPTVAIGGITLENMARVFAAGASSVAVISAIFAGHDVLGQTKTLAELARRCQGR